MALERVFEPLQIGACTLPNRVVRTAHGTFIGKGQMSDDLVAYHEARARGGVGLTILEIMGVHATSLAPLNSFDPGLEAGYRRLVEAVHPHGMRVFQQLWHGGHHGLTLDGSPPWSASDVPSVTQGVVPHTMTGAEIAEVVAAFGSAAALCERGGLDGVELHAAHGYLVQQFLSPLWNRRDDAYGGSFERRARFAQEVLRAVRAAVSPGFPVGVRLSPENTPGGFDPADNVRLVELLEAERLVDFVDVSMGGYVAFPDMIGGMHEPPGYELPTSTPITRAAAVPTIVSGRFRTLEEAEQVIRSGEAQLVGMTRAHVADPDLVRKTREGRLDEVRPCIGCNQGCVGGLLGPMRTMGCTVNVAVGRERTLGENALAPAAAPGRIAVIGGGPAGMEAARIARLRGHEVILLEARDQLGGALRVAARAPRRHGIADIVDWQASELGRLRVDVRLASFATVDDILALGPDAVVVATGSTPRMDGVQSARPGRPAQGVDQPHVLSSIDVLTGPPGALGPHALVVDDVGHYEGIAAAEHLLDGGAVVTFATRHNEFAPLLEPALISRPALERLSRGPFTLLTRTHLSTISDRDAELECLAGGPTRKVAANTVVLVSANRPQCTVVDALSDFAGPVHVVGDARSPRFLGTAIHEGHAVGLAL